MRSRSLSPVRGCAWPPRGSAFRISVSSRSSALTPSPLRPETLMRRRHLDSTTLTITITGTNDAPVAVADTNAGDAVTEAGVNPGNTPFAGDASATGNVLTNDTDVDTGDTKTVTPSTAPATSAPVTGTYGSRDHRLPTAATPTRSTTPTPTPTRWPRAHSRHRRVQLHGDRRARRDLDRRR